MVDTRRLPKIKYSLVCYLPVIVHCATFDSFVRSTIIQLDCPRCLLLFCHSDVFITGPLHGVQVHVILWSCVTARADKINCTMRSECGYVNVVRPELTICGVCNFLSEGRTPVDTTSWSWSTRPSDNRTDLCCPGAGCSSRGPRTVRNNRVAAWSSFASVLCPPDNDSSGGFSALRARTVPCNSSAR